MAGITLYDYQKDALERMKIGCILCGGVGSGKSRTSLAFYYTLYGGTVNTKNYVKMHDPPDLCIITTARKRDTGEWEEELAHFYMSTDSDLDIYNHKVVVDSWNNIGKYVGVKNAFFIFDEQRVVGSGQWVKSFLKITKENDWILLSATPGDCWTDYIPVFIANGFYKNRTQFNNEHIIYSRFSKFPKIEEAAMIDGCNPIQIFFKVVFPILKPTMISTAILETMWVWNDYLLPTLVLDIKKYRTIPMAIQYFRGGYGRVELAPMMACIIIAIIPIIILYMTCQKYIIEGVVAGAVKG